jgi:hypothetical protein
MGRQPGKYTWGQGFDPAQFEFRVCGVSLGDASLAHTIYDLVTCEGLKATSCWVANTHRCGAHRRLQTAGATGAELWHSCLGHSRMLPMSKFMRDLQQCRLHLTTQAHSMSILTNAQAWPMHQMPDNQSPRSEYVISAHKEAHRWLTMFFA